MKNLLVIVSRHSSDLGSKNRRFMKKVYTYEKEFKIHQKVAKVDEEKVSQYVANTPKAKLASDLIKEANYNEQLKKFINEFNSKHEQKMTLLDFSNYTTKFGELKNTPLKKEDIDMIKEFQKRKVDQKIVSMNEKQKQMRRAFKAEKYHNDFFDFTDEKSPKPKQQDKLANFNFYRGQMKESETFNYTQGPLKIKSDFILILLNVGMTNKTTTFRRIGSWRTLLFMGNGNGIISRGVGKALQFDEAMNLGIKDCFRNIIALPRDPRCTVPLQMKARFNSYCLEIKPKPSWNGYGHPVMNSLISAAGLDHCRFNLQNEKNNIYSLLNAFYKTVTKNTTPKELAERQGFKVYRHQFIRPLSQNTDIPSIK